MKLILHIGQAKTGTTSLQAALAMNRDALRRAGYLYPRLPVWREAHHALVPALLGGAQATPYVRARMGGRAKTAEAKSGNILEGLARSLDASGCHTLILSSEGLFRPFAPGGEARLAEALGRLADGTRVIAYLRHPADYYLSSLNTVVQGLQPPLSPPRATRIRVLDGYAALPRTDVEVRSFRRDTLAKGSVIDDFAEAAGLPPKLLAARPARALNETMSAEALDLMRDYAVKTAHPRGAPLGPRALLFRQWLRRADRRMPGFRRPKLRDGIAEAVLAETRDLQPLAERWQCRFDGVDLEQSGKGSDFDFKSVTRIGDVCEVDPDRLAALRRHMGWLMPRR